MEQFSSFLLDVVRRATVKSMGRIVEDNAPLMANGLDSLAAVVLTQTLSQDLGLPLGSVFALNHSSIEDMVNALIPRLESRQTSTVRCN